MPRESAEDLGKLIVRLTVGILLLFHAYGFTQGDPGIPNGVRAWGLPEFVAYLGFLAELVGPVLVILGIYTRIGGLVIAGFMLVGLLLYHTFSVEGFPPAGNHWFMLGKNQAGTHVDKYFLETQMFYLFSGLAVALFGQGRYGLGIGGRWN